MELELLLERKARDKAEAEKVVAPAVWKGITAKPPVVCLYLSLLGSTYVN